MAAIRPWALATHMLVRNSLFWSVCRIQLLGSLAEKGPEAATKGDRRCMIQHNPSTLAFLLRNLRSLKEGRLIHAYMIQMGYAQQTYYSNLLVQMYAKCGDLSNAHAVFMQMHHRNVFSWTILMGAYAHHGHSKYALHLFHQMHIEGVVPSKITLISILSACAIQAILAQGKLIHAHILSAGLDSDVVICNSLVNMYGKCGSLDDARRVFNRMPVRDVFSWTSMIGIYAQHDQGKEEARFYNEALSLFHEMQLEGIIPNKVTFISVLDACANQAALAKGKNLHTYIVACGFDSDVVACAFDSDVILGNTLVNLYNKCGSLEDARAAFDKMPVRDMVSWTAIIATYAQHGEGEEALQLFDKMKLEGFNADRVTFLSILSACSHSGLLHEGHHCFVSMILDPTIIPVVEHFNCMIDLLGRAGFLDEVQDLITNMPLEPSLSSWMSFLGACKMHKDVDHANWAAESVLKCDFGIAAPYVLLSNIYAEAGMWDNATRLRDIMEAKSLKKQPGHSLIEFDYGMHEFFAGDESHLQKREICSELERLSKLLKQAGYVPDTKVVLHNVEEHEKEHMLLHHSEKAAIAFGLISMHPGTPIRVIKNLRICSDCHFVAKSIAKINHREIIVRDANRFHHFKEGLCSCGDYW